MTDLIHYGVKGMKWGVRRDEGMLSRMVNGGRKVTSTHPDKAVRKTENARNEAAWKDYKKSTTKAERKADTVKAREEKMSYLMDEASKAPMKSLFVVGTPGGNVLATGNEFVNHLLLGGAVDVRMTNLYGYVEND